VPSHVIGETKNFVAFGAESHAEFGFFAGGDCWVESAGLDEGGGAVHGDAATGFSDAGGCVPFDIAKMIVNRGFGKTFAKAAADGNDARLFIERARGGGEPVGEEFAIAVDELDVVGLAEHFDEAIEAGIAGAGSG